MSLVPLADVKDHLNIPSSASDTKLQAALDAAESWVAQKLSAGTTLAVETITERAPGRGMALSLNHGPATTLTSVTGVYSGSLTLSDLDIDLEHGLIYYVPGSWMPFLDPWYTVVYEAGYDSLSPDLALAVKEVTRDFWAPQRGNRPSAGGNPVNGTPGMDRAMEIIYGRVPGGFA